MLTVAGYAICNIIISVAVSCQESPLMRRLFRLTVQQLDGLEDTQPNADGLIEEHLQEIFEDAERLHVFPTATGTISLWRGFTKKVPNS